ncbi:MAG: tetratricopeptide repeat protein [Burkholderiales bacterium]|nr:tetratricopeptide repeat protein [Burkholderiales bacterium]MBH2016452.1 tetratricopeptide repeat protein [Burkholderiales bacterium]
MAYQGSLSHIHALIIEDMAVQQTTLRGQLALLGISEVDVAANASDAHRLVKSRRYGLILCDYNLNQQTDGQQLFEHLREQNLLPADCLFFMVTAESGYGSVAAATEHHPDAYLLKPITASDIEDRLKAMLEKRQALLPINSRLAKDDLPGALKAADEVLALRNRWFMQALQIKGQTLLKLGRHEEAKAVYQQALDVRKDLMWARLGLARAHKAAGQFTDALKLAQEIIDSKDGGKMVAAYDVIAESLEATGDPQGALWVLRDASLVVPSSRRHRLVGESAYRNGDLDMARTALTKATKASRGSVVAQPQDTLLLAQTLVDLGESSEAMRVVQDATPAYKNAPNFGTTALAIQAQVEVAAGQVEQAEKTLAKARASLGKGKADFSTVALAKAELQAGNEEAGLALLHSAISADHENLRIKQMISKTLSETGHEDKIEAVIETAAAGMQNMVADARKLLRDSRIDDAVGIIENAVHEYPENTGVLLQAAQIQCMALRLKKTLDAERIDTIRGYLDRLDKLLPGQDRVTMMRRYFRETLGTLQAPEAQRVTS